MKSAACALLLSFGVSALAADGPVVINEIHYAPVPQQEFVEFVEFYNRGTNAVDLTGWKLSGGVKFAFPTNIVLAVDSYLVVAGDPAALTRKFGVQGVLGPWTGGLNSEGETLTLSDSTGAKVDEVDYQLGFPWPTVGEAPGLSIELVNPELDNSLGGNWRSSSAGGTPSESVPLFPAGSTWLYRKGTSEASSPTTAWRDPGFDDSTWSSGGLPIGYDPTVVMQTPLDDMRNNYRQVFLRKRFEVTGAAAITTLHLEAQFDDGFKLWLNGEPLLDVNMNPGEVPFDANSINGAREDNSFISYDLSLPAGALHEGVNVLAIQLANVDISSSSDAFFDASLTGVTGATGVGPTPGQRNRAFVTNAPPALRQVGHLPQQPRAGNAVTISARVTDPDGIDSVALEYQVVTPGNYIELSDPEYALNWTRLNMTPTPADTNVFSVTLPATLSRHRSLIRYRLIARDLLGAEVQAPYADDPTPNFAVFCYNGVHEWDGAVHPGASGALGQAFAVSRDEMNRLPVFLLLSKSDSVATATGWAPGQPNNQYRGSDYLWGGTMVYDGEVYDHIHYRARGGVWRYSMGKNAWKFSFNRGHDLKMKDNFGNRFNSTWDKLSFRPDIQQADGYHRGEQGLFESVGYRLFQLAGVDANNWAHLQFRIVDDAAEDKQGDQYGGDFWGLYLAVEEQDGRFLRERGLPDGNIYKMVNGFGGYNHTSKYGPVDYSDLSTFLNTYNGTTPSESWWRTNLNLPSYFSYQTIIQSIHHFDIADGKNYFYYHNSETGLWQPQPWDLDLTWADNMYRAGTSGGDEPFKSRVLANFSVTAPTYPNISLEFRNRVRELRDLLINADQAGAVIDEQMRIIHGTNALSITDADRAQWDYNPVMTNTAIILAEKAGWGLFYQFPQEAGTPKTFFGAVQVMKNYLNRRATILDGFAKEPDRPATPTLTYTGPALFPINRLNFHASDYTGAAGFASVKWRIAELSRPDHPSFQTNEPMHFEVQPTWETAEMTNAVIDLTFPAAALRPGKLYRARVRYTDVAGRTSNWSPPVEFTAGDSDIAAALVENLRFTELMYNPTAEGFEFIELFNASTVNALDLSGAKFTAGVDFTFPTDSLLAPGAYALVLKTTNTPAFRTYYGLPQDLLLYGPYDGSLDNGGETVTLKTSAGGVTLFSFAYSDQAPWPQAADGTGYSLVPAENGPVDLNDPLH
ncbi:MAG TPA: lamin tail domain-containing protein, partial [Candidatus Limnocylindria bacterium]|nr:lamin tail domain-containing protein [Candidatus Limnocylindria bacterium]